MNKQTQINRSNDKIWNSVFISVFIVNLIVHFCTTMMNTLTAKYVDYLGATETIIGLVTGIFALTALIFKIISAPAIDTFNRKYVLLFSQLIIFSAFICYSLSNTIPMVTFSRLLQGTGQAFTTTCCLTIASDSLPAGKMSTGIGYFALTQAISRAIAPAAGLKLSAVIGYNSTFAILAVITMIAVVLTANMKMSFKRTKKFKITLNSIIAKESLLPAGILFLLSTTFCVVNSFLVLFAEKQGVNTNIGYFFTVYAVTMLFTRPMIGKLSDKYGTVKVLIPSLFCFAASFILISFSTTLPMFLIAGFISAFGFGGCQPAIQAVAMKSVPKGRRGAASCTSYIGNDLGNLVGPTVAGAIAEGFGYTIMWRVMIIPIFIAMLVSIIFRYRITHAGEEFIEAN
jgi:MFS family permease